MTLPYPMYGCVGAERAGWCMDVTERVWVSGTDDLSENGAPREDAAPRCFIVGKSGEIELDCSTYQLRRHGVAQPIEPKAFDVLRYLIERRDRVVSTQELFAKFWPPHISASVLSHYI